jgi:hypothetical protein
MDAEPFHETAAYQITYHWHQHQGYAARTSQIVSVIVG